MKRIFSLLLLSFVSLFAFAQKEEADVVKRLDSIEKTFKYEHGTIKIKDGVATINVPPGFKYLEPVQAEKVLTEYWGNPKGNSITLGFILPENQGVLADKGYVFNIEYDEIGYVKDDDAEDIDYEEMLVQLKKDAEEENTERKKEGYDPIAIIGWASAPYYDKQKNILHWAKEIKFGESTVNTLNYNVRILGRKGVLILNAIATVNDLKEVKADIPKVLNSVQFNSGNKYTDFDSKVDNVAAWTIGGLVAGKILAKVGFFALILKFWKLLAIAVVGAFSAIKKFFGGKNKEPVAEYNTQKEIAEEEAPVKEDDTEEKSADTTPDHPKPDDEKLV